jgi:hypothetical protein
VGEYLNLLLTSLAKLEAHTDNRGFIEANVARVNIGAMLGEAWVEKYVLPSLHPDPWMLNGNEEWFKAHPVDGTDIRRGLHFYRVVRFSDALFTVGLGRINGFDVLRKRLRERTDMRALFAELEIASLLVKNKATVKVIGESGTRGQDFDLLVAVRGVSVSVEITAIAADAVMSARSILNRLRQKRTQVPANRLAILYLVVPDAWMTNYTAAFLLFNAAINRFSRESKRFNAVVLTWESLNIRVPGIPAKRYLQAVYNNTARLRIPDHSVFGIKTDKWGKRGYSESLLDKLRAYRLKQQIQNEIG